MKVLLITFLVNKAEESVLLKANNFLILLALFGPNLLGTEVSVKPAISFGPFYVITTNKALISAPTIQPLTVFLFLSPVLLGLNEDYPIIFIFNFITFL